MNDLIIIGVLVAIIAAALYEMYKVCVKLDIKTGGK